ncbi:hypothetical protein NKH18_50490 [Streptomyces sp. M10(2022)]
MEEGRAGQGLTPGPVTKQPSVAAPPTGTGQAKTLADLPGGSPDGAAPLGRAVPPGGRALVVWVSAMRPTGRPR